MERDTMDDLQQLWARHTALLERSVAIGEQLLHEQTVRKVRGALVPYVVWRALEAGLGLVLLWATSHVVLRHHTSATYLLLGGALLLFTLVGTATSARLALDALRLDYSGPVLRLQEALERQRRREFRALKWALLGGTLLWLPALLLPFEALTGVEVLLHLDPVYVLANVAFGVVVLILGQVLAYRFVEQPGLGPRAARIVDALSGRGLRRASAHLAELQQFGGEESMPAHR